MSVVASKAASIGLNLLKTTLNSIASIGISMAISWIIEGLTSLANKSKEAEEAFKESLNEFKDSTDELLESRKNVKDLTDSYTEIALSTDDLYSRKEDLLEIQDELNNSFDNEKGKIDLLTQSYGEVTKAILEKQNAENEKYVEENENKYKAAKNKLESKGYAVDVDGPGGFTSSSGSVTLRSAASFSYESPILLRLLSISSHIPVVSSYVCSATAEVTVSYDPSDKR